ncbi:histidine phosphatase family protein [Gynuella sunshinyii]|uniref:Fructose-2,6-bisphosphatase n=1 Tax=Gynuella sunshinyii YC6258 TaxID=1445510 RepID=A0A0C5VYX7_9GAMM|nr:histidine phosphatase family protein [Gynuella sunshinyii]AJQ95624.1 fructose-2,6-bisphosphatase [Gynuella sunshinyii YC6258]
MNLTSLVSPLRIYLIRHAETDWTLSRRYTGHTEIALTANGEVEAQKLGHRLRDTPFTHVFTSPRLRARQTCRLAQLGNRADIDPDLDEWNYGDYEGLRSVDIRHQRPEWNLFQNGCPQGETPEQVSERADRLIDRLGSYHGNVVVFSHGHFGSTVAVRWIGLPIATAEHFPLATASISILAFNPQHLETPVIALWNAILPRQMSPPVNLADTALRL